jgi:transposase-like protein
MQAVFFFDATILLCELHSLDAAGEGMFLLSRGQKGKIPIREWPSIAARHEQGESLASIARAYGCTAPAISYILRRLADSEGKRGGAGRSAASEPAARLRIVEDGADRSLAPELRERVHSDISAFLVAFDAACDRLTGETGGRLLEATDRLLRAAARTRIELERLGS